jgi:broad specificity phosphatase PhoE
VSDLIFITHPEVSVDPNRPIPDWSLSATGRARATTFATSQVMKDVTALWSSAEAKARETAAILADATSLTPQVEATLGENDRSATGFLPPERFEQAADQFFAHPTLSFEGWETAQKAQKRIVSAVTKIVAGHRDGALAVVSHGAVGTLLYCYLAGLPISRAYDQPSQGHYWTATLSGLKPRHGWQSID